MKVKRQTLIVGAVLSIISVSAFAQYPGQTQEAIKNKGAILYSPIVLAAELGKKTDSKENLQVPSLTGNPEKIVKWLKPFESKPLTFRTEGAAQPSDVVLSPLFRNCDQHYTVYFDFK